MEDSDKLAKVAAELDTLDGYIAARCTTYGYEQPREMIDYMSSRLDSLRKMLAE